MTKQMTIVVFGILRVNICSILYAGYKSSVDDILKYLYYFFPQNRLWNFLQIGDNLHEMPKPIFWQKKENINLPSAEKAQRDG